MGVSRTLNFRKSCWKYLIISSGWGRGMLGVSLNIILGKCYFFPFLESFLYPDQGLLTSFTY